MKTIVYTDHAAIPSIARQTSLTITSTDKLNLRLVRAFEFFSRFDLNIRHKSGKEHIAPDALSRLISTNQKAHPMNEPELDAIYVFHARFVSISDDFKRRIIDGYYQNKEWNKIID